MTAREDIQAKIAKLQQEVDASPGSARARMRLGTILLQVSAQRAEAEFRAAVELDPQFGEAWVNLGGILLARLDFNGCVEANQRALDANPALVHAYFNKGLGHLYLGQPDEMVACFAKVIELEQTNAAGQYYLAVGLLAQGKPGEAQKTLKRAIDLGYSPQPEFVRALEKELSKESGGPVIAFEIGSDKSDHNQN